MAADYDVFPNFSQLTDDIFNVFSMHRTDLLGRFDPEESMFAMVLSGATKGGEVSLSRASGDTYTDPSNLVKFFMGEYNETPQAKRFVFNPIIEGLQQAIAGEKARNPGAFGTGEVNKTNMISLFESEPSLSILMPSEGQAKGA